MHRYRCARSDGADTLSIVIVPFGERRNRGELLSFGASSLLLLILAAMVLRAARHG